MARVVVNTRVLGAELTGVQRYTSEIVGRIDADIERIEPTRYEQGVRGHVWEQVVLPARLKKNVLLWSPANTGPLAVREQVVTVHDVVPLDHPEWLNRRFAEWYRFLVPKLVVRARSIIAISEFTKQRLLETTNGDPEKIEVVYNGVDSRFYPQDEEKIGNVCDALGIPTRHYVLSLGSLEPRKNLARLMQAWSRVQAEIQEDVWLVVAGAIGKPLVFRDVRLEHVPTRVYFTGYVGDEYLPALYSGAIAFAYVSVYEGFGLPPLEAMACGTPPVTGDGTAFPEVVGDAGVMVDPFDVDAIAEGLRLVVEDSGLRDKLAIAGRRRADKMTWDICAQRTFAVLEGAAGA